MLTVESHHFMVCTSCSCLALISIKTVCCSAAEMHMRASFKTANGEMASKKREKDESRNLLAVLCI